jgi:hypothetical protein
MPINHIISTSVELSAALTGRHECICWSDDLTIGSVRRTSSLDEFSRNRNQKWPELVFDCDLTFKVPPDFVWQNDIVTIESSPFVERNRQIVRLNEEDEVMIWSGTNRQEVLMLCAVLHFLGTVLQSTPRLSLIHWADGGTVGSSNSSRLARLFSGRSTITPDLIAQTTSLWHAYTGPDPSELNALYIQGRDGDACLEKALHWILQDYPLVGSGLSLTEFSLLQNCGDGASISRIAAMTLGQSEDVISVELVLAIIGRFCFVSPALFEVVTPKPLPDVVDFMRLFVRRTALADELLRGEADYVGIFGLNRWMGGVHLVGHQAHWRYDPQRQCLVSSEK